MKGLHNRRTNNFVSQCSLSDALTCLGEGVRMVYHSARHVQQWTSVLSVWCCTFDVPISELDEYLLAGSSRNDGYREVGIVQLLSHSVLRTLSLDTRQPGV